MSLPFSNELNYSGYSRFVEQRRLTFPTQLPSAMSHLNLKASASLPPQETRRSLSARRRKSTTSLVKSPQLQTSSTKNKLHSLDDLPQLQLSPKHQNSINNSCSLTFDHSFQTSNEAFSTPRHITDQSWSYSSYDISPPPLSQSVSTPRSRKNSLSARRRNLHGTTINYNNTTSISPHLKPTSPFTSYLSDPITRRKQLLKEQENAMKQRNLVRNKTEYKEASVLFPVADMMSMKRGKLKKTIKKPDFLTMSASLNMQLNTVYRS